MILEWIAAGDGLVTEENYMERYEQERAYYTQYDYDKLFQKQP